ncbi:alpha/beta fold hydrolase [Streptomyces odontomachi]|uniref:alpha/beta fold hydrolase n=1 Tax=Streptomyces odontomachi TaxID=2944940 RepID=UPI002108A5B0|nr:alpha/beta hydrolase [Streptomyces sp. ODS25]
MSRPPTFVPPPGAMPRRLRTDRGDFAVIDASAGMDPPKGTVLLLPGYTGSKEDFIALHAPLAAAGYRSVAVDGRGQYESDGPATDEAPYAMDELARDVLAQVAAVGAPVHLVGHSLGGLVARAAVLRDPAPFRSLTLVSCGPGRISVAQQQRVQLLRDTLAVHSMAEVWEIMRSLEPPEETDTDGSADQADVLRRRWLGTQPAQLIATGRHLCNEPDRTDELAALRLPTHVLSGERDDTWPVPDMDTVARRIGAHRTVVQGAEHSPNTDRPKETAAALTAFWDRH